MKLLNNVDLRLKSLNLTRRDLAVRMAELAGPDARVGVMEDFILNTSCDLTNENRWCWLLTALKCTLQELITNKYQPDFAEVLIWDEELRKLVSAFGDGQRLNNGEIIKHTLRKGTWHWAMHQAKLGETVTRKNKPSLMIRMENTSGRLATKTGNTVDILLAEDVLADDWLLLQLCE